MEGTAFQYRRSVKRGRGPQQVKSFGRGRRTLSGRGGLGPSMFLTLRLFQPRLRLQSQKNSPCAKILVEQGLGNGALTIAFARAP